MTKEIQFFKGDLKESQDKFHYARFGQVYLLFDTNKSSIVPGHEKVLREKIVDFMVRAVRSLGPDPDYKLKVLGMASATGDHEYNAQLAGKRAYNSAMAAIKMFEKLQKTDPTIQGSTINPVIEILSTKYSEMDRRLMNYRGNKKIEQEQGFFRSAVFAFKAANDVEKFNSVNMIIKGPEAKRRAMEILEFTKNGPPQMTYDTPWGVMIIKRGQVWKPHDRLIVDFGFDRITYLEDDTLWSVPTRDFAREIMLDGVAEGVLRAKPLVEPTIVVMTFIQGIFVGPTIAISAKLIVLFMWGGAHEDLVRKGIDALRPAREGLRLIHQRYPTLWKVLMAKIAAVAGEQIKDAFVETVTKPENIAFFLGRIIRGLFFGPDISDMAPAEQAEKLVALSVGRVVFVVVEVAVLVTALHLPEAIIHVATEKVNELAQSLEENFKKPDIAINLLPPESQQIARELLAHPDTKAKMKELEKPLKDLQRVLNQFSKDFDLKKKH